MTKTCRSEKRSLSCADVAQWLDKTLEPGAFSDHSNNGLQIDAWDGPVRKVAFGVDASARFFNEAAARGARFAVCHHGVSWGGGIRSITGSAGEAVKAAIKKGVSLYASHLPLDAHPLYGNNFTMARALGLSKPAPAFTYCGRAIGCAGLLPRAERPEAFLARLRETISPDAFFFSPPASPRIRKVGICSGAAGFAIDEARAAGCDVLLTGEAGLEDWTAAENTGQCVAAAGHYRTEKWGVRALARALAESTGLETEFIDFDLPW